MSTITQITAAKKAMDSTTPMGLKDYQVA